MRVTNSQYINGYLSHVTLVTQGTDSGNYRKTYWTNPYNLLEISYPDHASIIAYLESNLSASDLSTLQSAPTSGIQYTNIIGPTELSSSLSIQDQYNEIRPVSRDIIKLNVLDGIAVTTGQTMTGVNCLGTTDFSEGSWLTSAASVTIPTTGIYSCSLAITTTSTGERATDHWTFSVNGTSIGEEGSAAYIRNTSSVDSATSTLTTVLDLNKDDTVGVMSRREGTITTAGSTVAAKSTVFLQRIV